MSNTALKINDSLSLKIKRKLEDMTGKSFLFNAREIRINSFQINDDLIIVAADKDIFTWSSDEALDRIREFMPIEKESEIDSKDLMVMPDRKQLTSLKDVIMDNIEQVKKDRTYVQQANAVNKSISTLINVANLELQYIKMFKKQ